MGDERPPVPTWKLAILIASLAAASIAVMATAGRRLWGGGSGASAPAAEAAPNDDRWYGTGTVRGTVRDETGAPVAGVEVDAMLREEPAARASRTAQLKDVLGQLRKATTGPDGIYAFNDLPDMRVFLMATKPEHTIDPVDLIGMLDARPDCVVDFVARRANDTTSPPVENR